MLPSAELRHDRALARDDLNQMATLEKQQGLTHGSPRNAQLLRDTQLANPLLRRHAPSDDRLGDVLSDLLGQARGRKKVPLHFECSADEFSMDGRTARMPVGSLLA